MFRYIVLVQRTLYCIIIQYSIVYEKKGQRFKKIKLYIYSSCQKTTIIRKRKFFFTISTYVFIVLLQTYNLDSQVGESSACATALLCGVKAHQETVGLDVGGRFDNCFSSFTSKVDSLIDWAQKSG